MFYLSTVLQPCNYTASDPQLKTYILYTYILQPEGYYGVNTYFNRYKMIKMTTIK
jgi:hypothetical protein